MAEPEEFSPEEIDERDKFDKEEIEDVEGTMSDFFMGLFGRKKKEETCPVDEDVGNDNTVDEEDDFIEEDLGGGNPFVQDSKLYGQDYDKLKVEYTL